MCVCCVCVLDCRLELEQLQSLRSAVREELQELEQQLEDRLVELTHQTKYGVYTKLQTYYKHVHIKICKVYTMTRTVQCTQDRWRLNQHRTYKLCTLCLSVLGDHKPSGKTHYAKYFS